MKTMQDSSGIPLPANIITAHNGNIGEELRVLEMSRICFEHHHNQPSLLLISELLSHTNCHHVLQNRSTPPPQHSDVWIPKLTHPPPTPILGIKENFSPLALNLELSSDSQGYCGHQPNEGLAQEPGDNTEQPQ